MKKTVTCVVCPVGCTVDVELENGFPLRVTGHGCPRGEAYAREEAVQPRRVLTTSVRVVRGALPLVSVRTSAPIPRSLIPEVMAFVRKLAIHAPVQLGQAVIKDVLGTGVDLVATRTVPCASVVDRSEDAPIIANAKDGEKTKPNAG